MTSPTGKIYIGQSWNIIQRKRQHKAEVNRHNSKLYNSIAKYGFEAHNFEVLIPLSDKISQIELDDYECWCIDYYKKMGVELLNTKGGGSNGKPSEEVREKHRGHKRNLGSKRSEETKLKMSIASTGRIKSPETCKRISEANKGKKMSDEFKEYMRKRMKGNNFNVGYKHTEQAKINMGLSHKGKIHKDNILKDEQVREIRSYPKPLEYGMIDKLSKQFNVSRGTIGNIRSGWKYKHVI